MLNDLINRYDGQKSKWREFYYTSGKPTVIVLAAAIPVMTTAKAWSWTIAIVGSVIVALEGISQLWHFHDRYVAARMLQKALVRERLVYEAGAGEYESTRVGSDHKQYTAFRISQLLDRYETEVLSVLKEPATHKAEHTRAAARGISEFVAGAGVVASRSSIATIIRGLGASRFPLRCAHRVWPIVGGRAGGACSRGSITAWMPPI